MNQNSIVTSTLITLIAAGCASSTGTKPHDMSVMQHEQAATTEDQATGQHAEQYNPDATTKTERCGRGACWTSVSNPTDQHKSDSEQHEKLAAEHRAAAQALRDVEAKECAGLDESDIATSPFYHREDIAEVSRVSRTVQRGRQTATEEVGGRVVFRAVPGMTAEWLQRLVDCHLARAAAVGHSMPEMPYCPLVPKGVKATAVSVGDGFAVEMTSDDPASDAEVWRRVQALK